MYIRNGSGCGSNNIIIFKEGFKNKVKIVYFFLYKSPDCEALEKENGFSHSLTMIFKEISSFNCFIVLNFHNEHSTQCTVVLPVSHTSFIETI